MNSAECSFPKDHPSLAGHFPGAPIIPGALLLARVQQIIHDCIPEESYVFRSAKFLRPVRPGDLLRIAWKKGAMGELAFLCEVQDELALTGVLVNVKAQSG